LHHLFTRFFLPIKTPEAIAPSVRNPARLSAAQHLHPVKGPTIRVAAITHVANRHPAE
jgi:hypothetical protein